MLSLQRKVYSRSRKIPRKRLCPRKQAQISREHCGKGLRGGATRMVWSHARGYRTITDPSDTDIPVRSPYAMPRYGERAERPNTNIPYIIHHETPSVNSYFSVAEMFVSFA